MEEMEREKKILKSWKTKKRKMKKRRRKRKKARKTRTRWRTSMKAPWRGFGHAKKTMASAYKKDLIPTYSPEYETRVAGQKEAILSIQARPETKVNALHSSRRSCEAPEVVVASRAAISDGDWYFVVCL